MFLYPVGAEYMMVCRCPWNLRVVHNDPMPLLSALFLNSSWQRAGDFNTTCLSTYDFSTLYTTLPHDLIKDKLIDLIERTFQGEGSSYLKCIFTSEKT